MAFQKIEQTVGVDGAVLFSCGSSNRVGALFALKARLLDGKSPDEAIAIGEACGMTRLEPVVRQALGMAPLTAADGVR